METSERERQREGGFGSCRVEERKEYINGKVEGLLVSSEKKR